MNRLKNNILAKLHKLKELPKSKVAWMVFLALHTPANISWQFWWIKNNIYNNLKTEELKNSQSELKSKYISNIPKIDTVDYSFDRYTIPKLEYNDYEKWTRNEAFEYLWFSNGLDKAGNMKESSILKFLANTDGIANLVEELSRDSFDTSIVWQQNAKSLDLVRWMLESGNNNHAKSIANCVGIRQFSIWAGKNYGIVKSGKKGKIVDNRTNPKANILASHKYLKDNYEFAGDLWLAYWWYHCGLGNLGSIINIYESHTDKNIWWLHDIYFADELPEALIKKISSLKDNSYDYFAKIKSAKYIYNQRKNNPQYIYDRINLVKDIKTFKARWSMVEYEWYPIDIDNKIDNKNISNEVSKIDFENDQDLDKRLLYVLQFLYEKTWSNIYNMTDFAKIENKPYYDAIGIHTNAIIMKKWIKIPKNKIINYDVFRFWLYQMRIWWWISRCEEKLPDWQVIINISINPNIKLQQKTNIYDK